jgi:hypothetical protein
MAVINLNYMQVMKRFWCFFFTFHLISQMLEVLTFYDLLPQAGHFSSISRQHSSQYRKSQGSVGH